MTVTLQAERIGTSEGVRDFMERSGAVDVKFCGLVAVARAGQVANRKERMATAPPELHEAPTSVPAISVRMRRVMASQCPAGAMTRPPPATG